MAQIGKNLPAIQEIHVQSLGREDPLERETSLQYSCLENFMEKEPGGLQSIGSQIVRQD